MMELNIKNLSNIDKYNKALTRFIDETLKENKITYAIAVMAEKINRVRKQLQQWKEGAK